MTAAAAGGGPTITSMSPIGSSPSPPALFPRSRSTARRPSASRAVQHWQRCARRSRQRTLRAPPAGPRVRRATLGDAAGTLPPRPRHRDARPAIASWGDHEEADLAVTLCASRPSSCRPRPLRPTSRPARRGPATRTSRSPATAATTSTATASRCTTTRRPPCWTVESTIVATATQDLSASTSTCAAST